MYLKAINATLAAWVVGLFADANIRLGDPQGFLCLRVPAIGRSCACGDCCLCWPWGFVSSAN